MCPPHLWGGDPEGRRRSLADEAPPHSWGGGGEAAGGARSRTRLLPIHGEVAAKPPEGLARGRGSSPFMGRWRRSRRRGSLANTSAWITISPPRDGHTRPATTTPSRGRTGASRRA